MYVYNHKQFYNLFATWNQFVLIIYVEVLCTMLNVVMK